MSCCDGVHDRRIKLHVESMEMPVTRMPGAEHLREFCRCRAIQITAGRQKHARLCTRYDIWPDVQNPKSGAASSVSGPMSSPVQICTRASLATAVRAGKEAQRAQCSSGPKLSVNASDIRGSSRSASVTQRRDRGQSGSTSSQRLRMWRMMSARQSSPLAPPASCSGC